ncbi:helix-turn-helix domain-containing protein [Paludibacterium yongneupense]|uniref:helix-turn-helix domain-containing protein n=1 Tax=Paludibacterium yongneupense TaxID=400061 RepID=UPI0003FDE0DA|nr:helix-turn-helix domain-containing protein [Paludibacterium yongneupense]
MNQSKVLPEPLLTRKDAAAYLGLSVYTLNEWACTGRHALKFYRIGRKAMYKRSDLDAFITARGVGA